MVLAIAQIAAADPPSSSKPRIGVVTAIAVNVDASRVDALGQDLADALMAELDLEAIGGPEVRRKLPPEGIAAECVVVPRCVADVAKRLSANQLLFLVVVDTGNAGAIQIDTTWVDPATGQTASRPAIAIAAISEAKERFAAAARQLLPDAPVRPKIDLRAGPSVTTPPAVPRHFTTTSMITAGAAIVGLGVGIGFGLKTRSRYNACGETEPCSSDDKSSIRTTAIVADLGFLTAIGCAIATGVLYAGSSREAQVIVAPTADGAAVTALGRF